MAKDFVTSSRVSCDPARVGGGFGQSAVVRFVQDGHFPVEPGQPVSVALEPGRKLMRVGTSDNDGGTTMPIAYRQPVSGIRVPGGLPFLQRQRLIEAGAWVKVDSEDEIIVGVTVAEFERATGMVVMDATGIE